MKRKLQTIFLESLACETPVIASYVGGISEILSETNLIQSGLSFFISDIRGIKQRYYCLVWFIILNLKETYQIKKLQ